MQDWRSEDKVTQTVKDAATKAMRALAAVGPGIFAIGYTIGTGSVTSMAKAGADYGLGLLWVLALSCLFSGVLMSAYGRFAAVTGETALHGMVRFMPCGRVVAALVFIGVVVGQYTCLGGIMILTSGAIKEAFGLSCGVFPIACAIMDAMYALLMVGRYSFFEKILAFFVFLMALTFVVSVFATWPDAATLKRAIRPLAPSGGASLLMLAAFVGTTMAAPTFVTRPLLVREKGWGSGDLKTERRDSAVSASLMFAVSGSVMAVAAGALFAHGRGLEKILDIAATLEPVAGRFAVSFFMVGVLAAGLSSVFPIMMVAPLLIGDWKDGRMETNTPLFRVICLVAALWGLVVPLLGSNPVTVTVAVQVSNVFVLPLAVAAILFLVNRRSVMGEHCAGWVMNALLAAALAFAVATAAAGAKALLDRGEKGGADYFERGEIKSCEKHARGDERLEKAFAFLKRADLPSLAVGRHEIDGDKVFALVQECELKPVSDMKIEAHRRYIDIQAPLTAAEAYGVGRLSDANAALPFDVEKDIGFYKQPMDVVVVNPGEFIMFRPPYGAHGPSCSVDGPRRIKKLVIKVLVEP